MVDSNSRTSVLVVDDEELVLKFLAQVVEASGYKAISANCGEKALDILDSDGDRLCMVITDVSMPGMSGVALARKIRSKDSELPIVVISGYTDEEIVAEDLPSGVIFRQKPLNLQEIRHLLEQGCDVA